MFDANKMKLGIFVFSAVFLICVVFFAVGLFDFGTPKVQAYTFFSESVQGLEIGSFVKYRGVTIGKVTDITLSIHESRIRVDMEIYLNKIWNNEQRKFTTINEHVFKAVVQEGIKEGLRARIELSGIAGGKYINCDYQTKPANPPEVPPEDKDDKIFYIPSEPSMLGSLRTNIGELLVRISSIDYKGISENINELVQSSTAFFKDPNLKATVDNLQKVTNELRTAMDTFNTTFDRKRSEEFRQKVMDVLTSVNNLSQKLETTLQKANVPETAAVFRRTAMKVNTTSASLEDTLRKLNEVADSLSELIRTLDDNPASVIRGK